MNAKRWDSHVNVTWTLQSNFLGIYVELQSEHVL